MKNWKYLFNNRLSFSFGFLDDTTFVSLRRRYRSAKIGSTKVGLV